MSESAAQDIQGLLVEVMNEVTSIGKDERNAQQGFNFRGVDSVINRVGPAFRRRGIVPSPRVEDISFETVPTRNGGTMRNTVVRVRLRLHGPGSNDGPNGNGNFHDEVVYGEAADSGDKSVTKAQSVAYRTALLLALCIPTDQPDPDLHTFERAAPREATGRDWREEVQQAKDADTVRNLYREAAAFRELTDSLRDYMQQRVAELAPQEQQDREPATVGS